MFGMNVHGVDELLSPGATPGLPNTAKRLQGMRDDVLGQRPGNLQYHYRHRFTVLFEILYVSIYHKQHEWKS